MSLTHEISKWNNFRPKEAFLLITWQDSASNRNALNPEIHQMIERLGLKETHPSLWHAVAAILMDRVVDAVSEMENDEEATYYVRPMIDKNDIRTAQLVPEHLLSVCWAETRSGDWTSEYYGVYLPHEDTYFVVCSGFDAAVGDNSDWLVGEVSGQRPSIEVPAGLAVCKLWLGN